ncbi:calcium-binding and coiled-coil domain-containing protein 1-like [Periplaneta americana]|uniref:calcium-binding and coiled-coil domain-containing protein 1-like n=1 Tax=Periplaneta americana TaxID=6978 RepID=UPI0037E9A786
MNAHCLRSKVLPPSCSSTMPIEVVKFQNVKSKYYLNEDILLEYVLDAQVQPSYRDWIGLYPRGWNNLLQYVTFEWIISRPCDVSLRRNIVFRSRYHSQVVHTDREYQFLYVNKQIEVLGISQFFRFIPADTLSSRNTVRRISSDKTLTSGYPLHRSDNLSAQMVLAPRPCASVTMLLDGPQKAVTQKCQQSKANPRAFISELALATTSEVPPLFQVASNQMVATCTNCKRQADFSHVQQTPDNKVKSSAEQIRNLEERIQDLENDLEMSQVTQKRLKFAAHHSKRERMAYQKFVNELLYALSQKSIVRVIDGQGAEMLVKRVPNNGPRMDAVDERPAQNVVKTSHRERQLKAVIGSQEQTIRELLMRLHATSTACNDLARKVDLVTSEQNSLAEEPHEALDSVKEVPQALIAVVPHGQGDVTVDVPETKKVHDDTKTVCNTVPADHLVTDGNEATTSNSHELPSNQDKPNGVTGDLHQNVDDLASSMAPKSQFSDHTPEHSGEKALTNTATTESSEKPADVVIEKDSGKYAIVRY